MMKIRKSLLTWLLAAIVTIVPLSTTSAIAAEIWSDVNYTEPWAETPASATPQLAEKVAITFDVAPRIENGRSLVPLRKIFEVLGAQVQWNGTTQEVTAVKGQLVIKLKINSQTAYVNNKAVTLEVPAKIVQQRTLVPVRFVSEALGSKVDYEAVTKKVTIDNKYYFYLTQNQSQPTPDSNNNSPTAYKEFFGNWYVWVSGGWTAPDPVTGISTYTKGAAGGSITIDSNGTFVWDMKTAIYQGTWGAHPTSPANLILKSNDGWDYTLTKIDAKTIKWYSYGLEYYGTRD